MGIIPQERPQCSKDKSVNSVPDDLPQPAVNAAQTFPSRSPSLPSPDISSRQVLRFPVIPLQFGEPSIIASASIKSSGDTVLTSLTIVSVPAILPTPRAIICAIASTCLPWLSYKISIVLIINFKS